MLGLWAHTSSAMSALDLGTMVYSATYSIEGVGAVTPSFASISHVDFSSEGIGAAVFVNGTNPIGSTEDFLQNPVDYQLAGAPPTHGSGRTFEKRPMNMKEKVIFKGSSLHNLSRND